MAWSVDEYLDALAVFHSADAVIDCGNLVPKRSHLVALTPVVTVATTDPLRDAAELMLAKSISHVVAMNPETKAAIGILSTLDIAGVLAWGEM